MYRKSLFYWLFIGFVLVMIVATAIEMRTRSTVLTPISDTLPMKLVGSYIPEKNIKLMPIGNDNTVIVLEKNKKLIAISNETGETVWEHELENSVNIVAHYKATPFNITQDHTIILAGERQLLALDLATGQVTWSRDLATAIKNFTDILIIDSIIIITGIDSSSNNRVAGYSIEDGHLIWQIVLPARVLQHVFPCAGIPVSETILTNLNTICLLLIDRLMVIDPLTIIETLTPATRMNITVSLTSFNKPVHSNGFIFTNPSQYPYIHVFDVSTQAEFNLPVSCTKNISAKPVSIFSNRVLVGTGCGDIYTLPIDDIQGKPEWMLHLQESILSSFVTPDGQWGYVLLEIGEILAVDLLNGQRGGVFAVEPGKLRRKDQGNGLVANPPYLYGLLNEYNLFIFTTP